MQYYKKFPVTQFLLTPASYKTPAKYINLIDITTNVRFKREILNNITLYDYYLIEDGETFEMISEKLYGSPHYNWILMLLNDVFDYRNDGFKQPLEFEQYIIDKYDSIENAQENIQHYINKEGFIVNFDNEDVTGVHDATEVNSYDYEVNFNEQKRKIKVISKNVLEIVLQNFRDLVN